MACRKNKNLISSNAGMSLIELVVGLLILTIIMAPTLGMFVTALRSTSMASLEMGAETLAQNVQEEIKYYGVKNFKTSMNASNGYINEVFDEANGKYVYHYSNKHEPGGSYVYGYEGNNKYIVKVEVDESGSEGVRYLNQHEFGNVSSVAMPTTLLINPNEGVADPLDTADEQAISYFHSMWKGPAPIDRDAVKAMIDERNLTVTVSKESENTYLVNYAFNYSVTDPSLFNGGTFTFAPDPTELEGLKRENLNLIYFFYTPWAATYDEARGEVALDWTKEIVLLTDEDVDTDIDMYLVVQRDKKYPTITGSIYLSETGSSKVHIQTESGITRAGSTVAPGKAVDSSTVDKVRVYNVTVEVYRVVNGTQYGSKPITSTKSTITD